MLIPITKENIDNLKVNDTIILKYQTAIHILMFIRKEDIFNTCYKHLRIDTKNNKIINCNTSEVSISTILDASRHRTSYSSIVISNEICKDCLVKSTCIKVEYMLDCIKERYPELFDDLIEEDK